MKFRKKPIVIDAFIWTGDTSQSQFKFPEWALEKIKRNEIEFHEKVLFTHCSKGSDVAKIGYYIIFNHNGEVSSCAPDVFLEEYDKVEDLCAD